MKKCGTNVNCQTYKQTGYDCYGRIQTNLIQIKKSYKKVNI